jgi:NTP pyrophosphatase (non-canonical NTP hydrolase)
MDNEVEKFFTPTLTQDLDKGTRNFIFIQTLAELANEVHETAKEKGWYEKERNDFEMLALVHSEISEVVEALRKGNPKSEKLDPIIFSAAEEEMADAVIRILDQCRKNKWNLGAAILAKMAYNKTRPYRHGNKLA